MNYLTTVQASEKWGITANRIGILAKQGRVPGAIQIGMRWFIPDNAEKPADARTKGNKRIVGVDEDFFRYPLFVHKDINSFYPPLSDEETILKKALEEFHSCCFEKAGQTLGDLDNTTKNRYVRISVIYIKCMICLNLCKISHFLRNYSRLQIELQKDFPEKPEMQEYLYMIDANRGFVYHYSDKPVVKVDYEYHKSFLPHLALLSCVSLVYSDKKNLTLSVLQSYEINCLFVEKTGDFATLQAMHLYLGILYLMLGHKNESNFHLRKALEIAFKYTLYYQIVAEWYYISDQLKPLLADYPPEFKIKLEEYGENFHNSYLKFTDAMKQNTISQILFKREYMYAIYANQGFSNKQVAKLMNLSESTVQKGYSDIYAKLFVSKKSELVELYRKAISVRV